MDAGKSFYLIKECVTTIAISSSLSCKTLPVSGGLLINIVCTAMMFGPVNASTYFTT